MNRYTAQLYLESLATLIHFLQKVYFKFFLIILCIMDRLRNTKKFDVYF